MSAPRHAAPLSIALDPYDLAGLKVIEKSRRIGVSWAEAYDAVMHAGEDAGNVYYQAYNQDMTRGFIDDCAEMGCARCRSPRKTSARR